MIARRLLHGALLAATLFLGARGATAFNAGIVVAAGKFLAVGAVRNSQGARQVRLADDDYVLPGFIDLHAHYAVDLFGGGRVDETVVYPVLFLANGVTSMFPAG